MRVKHPWLSAVASSPEGLAIQPWQTTSVLGNGAASLRDPWCLK